MKALLNYTITSTTKRSLCGNFENTNAVEFEFGFPVDETGKNKISIDEPYLEYFNGISVRSDIDSVADMLDDFINNKHDITVVVPAPEKCAPQLKITSQATGEYVYVY